MALKILLVDPNEVWLNEASKFFEENLYKTERATNGKDAQMCMYNSDYFAVVVNYSTQNNSAIQVLKFIKRTKKKAKAVLVFNSEEEMIESDYTEEQILKMGATEYMIMPFEMNELKEVLEEHQSLSEMMSQLPRRDSVSEVEEVQAQQDEFTSIKIEDFYNSKAVLFDVFIKISESKFLKILHAGDKFEKDRIDHYKNEKNIDVLYFKTSDRKKFIQYNNYLAKKIVDNENVSSKAKVNLLKNITDKITEEAFTNGLKPQVVDEGKQVCESVFNLVEKQEDLYKLLKSFHDFDPKAVSHSFLVTLYSAAIIKQYEWQSKATIETAALACVFHDIGKINLPPTLLNMKPEDMTPDQFEQYKSHPEVGCEMIEGNKLINPSVKQIILQHHENFDGTGFPFALKGKKILTLANIIHLADDFAHMIVDDEMKPTEALKLIISDKSKVVHYNSSVIENFIKVFVDPGKLTKERALPSRSRLVKKAKAS